MLSSTENSRIQGLFKAFELFSSTFQGIFNFQGLFMQALQIQVLFKHVGTLLYVDSGSSDHAGQMTDWRYRVFEKVMSTMCEE